MEVVITLSVLAALLLTFMGIEQYQQKQRAKQFIKSLKDNYGKAPNRSYQLERFEKIGSFYRKHPAPYQLDDITWNDLGMDDIFKRMNYSFSATGEEYLYYILRTPEYEEDKLQRLESQVCFFMNQEEERVKVQELMHRLGYVGKYSLYDYLDHLDYLGERNNRKHYLLNLLYFPCVCLLFFQFTWGVAAIIGLMLYNIVTYYKEKGEIDPYVISFGFVQRLYLCAEKLAKMKLPGFEAEQEQIQRCCKTLKNMYRGSFWVMSPGRGNATGGNPMDMIMDYMRMIFHLDIMQFNKMLSIIRCQMKDVDLLIRTVGYIETAISIGSFRASLEHGYTVPIFTEERTLVLEEGYHPLISSPVKNSIRGDGCVLLTGSNASGKSTFLKMVALNGVLAQTIHTAIAANYRGPMYRIVSSMALRDNLAGGESYYIVEIKALKRILDMTEQRTKENTPPVLCFVDEVLRGTNTVERIAASSQILRSLSERGVLCFAATHDIELTELLKDYYTNYHFAEEICDGDVVFNYQLRSGKASTRNAIRLLEMLGYDEDIISRAGREAELFTEKGVWELA
ncbi:MAG: hypothetical protein IJ335_00845 [Lachnospiraceae bacterium]|nr:hypothetical protein [Lachnospiraceae bacterium]